MTGQELNRQLPASIEQLADLHQSTTPGPWAPVDLRHQRGGQIRIFPGRGVYLANVIGRLPNASNDARFIVEAHRLWPRLLSELDAGRTVVAVGRSHVRAEELDSSMGAATWSDLRDAIAVYDRAVRP
jgi:hypothetical protein